MSIFEATHHAGSASSNESRKRSYRSLFTEIIWKLRHPNDVFLHPKSQHHLDCLWYQSNDGHTAPVFRVKPRGTCVSSIFFVCGPYFHPLIYLLNENGFLPKLLEQGFCLNLISHRGHDLGKGAPISDMEHIVNYDIPAAIDAVKKYDDFPLTLLGAGIGSILSLGWLSLCGDSDFSNAVLIDMPYGKKPAAYRRFAGLIPANLSIPVKAVGSIAAHLDIEPAFNGMTPSMRRRILHDGLCAAPLRFAQQYMSWSNHPTLFGAEIPHMIHNIQLPTKVYQPEATFNIVAKSLGNKLTYKAMKFDHCTASLQDWKENCISDLNLFIRQNK